MTSSGHDVATCNGKHHYETQVLCARRSASLRGDLPRRRETPVHMPGVWPLVLIDVPLPPIRATQANRQQEEDPVTSKAREALAERRGQTQDDNGDGGGQMTIAQLLDRQRDQIGRALPKHMDADRFARIVLTEIRRTPALGACTAASLLGAVMLCAQLGLEPGPLGHAYLVPYRNKGVPEVQFQLGYKGIVALARRSGEIVSLVAREVCEGDEFEFEYGLDEKLVHRPTLIDRGEPHAFYGVAKFADGGHTILVMSVSDVEKYRVRAQGQKTGERSGPWLTDFAAMARKTVIRRMAPFLPMTIEAARAIEADDAVTRIGAEHMGELVTIRDDTIDDGAPIDVETTAAPDKPVADEGKAKAEKEPAPVEMTDLTVVDADGAVTELVVALETTLADVVASIADDADTFDVLDDQGEPLDVSAPVGNLAADTRVILRAKKPGK